MGRVRSLSIAAIVLLALCRSMSVHGQIDVACLEHSDCQCPYLACGDGRNPPVQLLCINGSCQTVEGSVECNMNVDCEDGYVCTQSGKCVEQVDDIVGIECLRDLHCREPGTVCVNGGPPMQSNGVCRNSTELNGTECFRDGHCDIESGPFCVDLACSYGPESEGVSCIINSHCPYSAPFCFDGQCNTTGPGVQCEANHHCPVFGRMNHGPISRRSLDGVQGLCIDRICTNDGVDIEDAWDCVSSQECEYQSYNYNPDSQRDTYMFCQDRKCGLPDIPGSAVCQMNKHCPLFTPFCVNATCQANGPGVGCIVNGDCSSHWASDEFACVGGQCVNSTVVDGIECLHDGHCKRGPFDRCSTDHECLDDDGAENETKLCMVNQHCDLNSGEICSSGTCTSPGVGDEGVECLWHEHCVDLSAMTALCVNNVCEPLEGQQCDSNETCPNFADFEYACLEHTCVRKCSGRDDCRSSQICENRHCIETGYCGDGEVQYWLGEYCDDGNDADGDGCDANCKLDEALPCFDCGQGHGDCDSWPWNPKGWRDPVVECEGSESIAGLASYWPLATDFKDHSGHDQNLENLNNHVELRFSDSSAPFADGYAYFDPNTKGPSALYAQDFNPFVDDPKDTSYTFEFWWKPEGNRREAPGGEFGFAECEDQPCGLPCGLDIARALRSCGGSECGGEGRFQVTSTPDISVTLGTKFCSVEDAMMGGMPWIMGVEEGRCPSDEVVISFTCEQIAQKVLCDCDPSEAARMADALDYGNDFFDIGGECEGLCSCAELESRTSSPPSCNIGFIDNSVNRQVQTISVGHERIAVRTACPKTRFAAHWAISYNTVPFGRHENRRGGMPFEVADEHFMLTSGIGRDLPLDFHGCDAGPQGSFDGPVDGDFCKADGQWHHIAFVFEESHADKRRLEEEGRQQRGTGTLYVDGLVVAKDPVASDQFALPRNDGFDFLLTDQHRSFCNLPEPEGLERNHTCGSLLALGADIDSTTAWNFEQYDVNQMLQGAMTEVRYWSTARTQNQILAMMNYRITDLECNRKADPDVCGEQESSVCHGSAFCEKIDGVPQCMCEMGMIGDGIGENGCSTIGWAVRVVYEGLEQGYLNWLEDPVANNAVTLDLKHCFGSDGVHFQRGVFPFSDGLHFESPRSALLVNALFLSEPTDEFVASLNVSHCVPWSRVSPAGVRKYAWTYDTIGRRSLQILPTGLELNAVSFEPACATSGCWVFDVTYTTGGPEAFNAMYLPKAVGDDSLSTDFQYDSNTLNSFQPSNFPCRTADYVGGQGSNSGTPDQLTTCCMIQNYTADPNNPTDTTNGFIHDYRPTTAFTNWVKAASPVLCHNRSFPEVIDRADFNESDANPQQYNFVNFPTAFSVPHRFLDGPFSGLDESPGVTETTVLDPFFYQYRATIKLDEVELRRKAGLLRGTIGVEHSVDTFLGFVNFRPTGTHVLDSFATQVNVHLEKTSFFSISTYGTNDYTFLEYVNMRLVSIYNEDTDFSGADESLNRTVRTDSSDAANYVQVTFTLAPKYSVNTDTSLIPLDSVRAGAGTFLDGTLMTHKCTEWTTGPFERFSDFNATLQQDCGPGAAMCISPASIPDSFIVFNVPLGIDWYQPAADDLSNNVFVELVISAIDDEARNQATEPNEGEAPWQMKTTLSASIPVVNGGINIFCDGLTSKTDLKDVANVDIVVGSASDKDELLGLRILENIASTQLSPEGPSQIDTSSIEDGLMTLVLKGDSSYFSLAQRTQVTIELEDLVTIHIMEDDGDGSDASRVGEVMGLISSDPADNSDSNGLLTDGYALNGAFLFSVDRSSQRAHLQPSRALLDICPWNPPRPLPGNLPLETCVTRRDVQERGFPARVGALSNAIEICKAPTTAAIGCTNCCAALSYSPGSDPVHDESKFFGILLGSSDYAHQLAVDFANAIDERYGLNGRFVRAFWINPGYEWAPPQTGGASIFSVSQTVFLFALVTLDENVAADPGALGPAPTLSLRRMLLSSTDALAEQSAAGGQAAMSFAVSPQSMLASAFNVPVSHVVALDVTLQLTMEHICASPEEQQDALRETLDDYLSGAASAFETVQVTSVVVELNGESCARRQSAPRKLLSSFSAATAKLWVLVVFADGETPTLNLATLEAMPGIHAVDVVNEESAVVDDTFTPSADSNSDDQASSSNMALIIGACAGAAGVVVVAAGTVLWYVRRRREEKSVQSAISAISIEQLKAELHSDI